MADDDEDDRMLFVEALGELPLRCDVRYFTDGIHLMAQLMIMENQIPDIVFLDINMPLMCGMECLHKIRQTERILALPVIIYSTSFEKNEVEQYQLMGASGYLQKPTSFNQLKTLLYKCITPYTKTGETAILPSFIIQV